MSVSTCTVCKGRVRLEAPYRDCTDCGGLGVIFDEPSYYGPIEPLWYTDTVKGLTETIIAENAWDRLPILADAFEEAGCSDELILNELRKEVTPEYLKGPWFSRMMNGGVKWSKVEYAYDIMSYAASQFRDPYGKYRDTTQEEYYEDVSDKHPEWTVDHLLFRIGYALKINESIFTNFDTPDVVRTQLFRNSYEVLFGNKWPTDEGHRGRDWPQSAFRCAC